MRWLFSGLTAVLITAILPILPSLPAVANPTGVEDHFHVAISTAATWPQRSVTVECPSGQIVWGFGAATIGGEGRVALTEVFPNASLTAVTATAYARHGWQGDFRVQATATCWPAGNVALERMVGQGGALAHAECPGQKVVYATGFQLAAELGEPYATRVQPDSDMSGATVVSGGAEPIGLSTRVLALCGLANVPQIYTNRRTEATVPVSAGPSTTAIAPPMEHSPTGWSWVTGVGVASTAAGMFIDALGPAKALDQGWARMSREGSTLAMTGEGGDEMTVWGTCIGAWY